MSIYLTLGSYTDKGAAGLVGAKHVDRRAAMVAMCSSVGAKLMDYHITRGAYDFCVIAEADSFAQIASMTLTAKGSGAVDNLVTLESIDVEEIRSVAKGVQYTPPSG
jgi:uncharacterized protein with GYD domain